MASLKQLKRNAGTIKMQLTRFKNYLSDFEEHISYDKVTINQIVCRLEKIESLWEYFDDIQNKIEDQLDSDNSEENHHREDFETDYFECIAKAKTLINNGAIDNSETRLGESCIQTQSSVQNQNAFNIKLPTLHLPIFSGLYEQWSEFYDTFNSLIHQNGSLNDIQKFHYLRSSLKGEASHIISSLEVSAHNYEVAWCILRERYENKKIIINKHIQAIFDLPVVTKESHVTLRRLFDDISKHIRALEALGQPVQHWDTLLIHILTSKFDNITRREWESFDADAELPTFNSIKKFLKRRCEILEALVPNTQNKHGDNDKYQSRNKKQHSTFHAYNHNQCAICKNSHNIYSCNNFLQMPVQSRITEVKRLKLCINCLRGNHSTRECRSSLCSKCNQKHNTLLHIERDQNEKTSSSSSEQREHSNVQQVSMSSHHKKTQPNEVLLPTANIYIVDASGKYQVCRALLDSGSQANFVTEDLCNRLGLKRSNIDSVICGINGVSSNISHQTRLNIHSMHNSFHLNIKCLIIPKISDLIPLTSFEKSNLKIPGNIRLADPTFNISKNIDLLIGSAVFWQLLCVGQIKCDHHKFILQKTKLGWIVAGPLASKQTSNTSINYCVRESHDNIETQLAKFWSLEEVANTINLTKEEQEVEEHFTATTTRDPSGRFIVSVPKRENICNLGESRNIALKRFYNLEKKLRQNSELGIMYIKFMNEYEELGHMCKINEDATHLSMSYYLPHHPVIKDTSSTTKLRVVFDGSCKTSTNLSLNDVQKTGPVVQDELFVILIRFRQHTYVITADVAKMYRQVSLSKEDRSLHRIFWRPDSSQELGVYELNTVTYGTASGSYLTTRCLKELANDMCHKDPLISRIIEHDFYVDDLITGSDSMNEIKHIYTEVSNTLSSACFPLRKWKSNHSSIFEEFKTQLNDVHQFCDENSIKTLGIVWIPNEDILKYEVKPNQQNVVTKRTILSITAQIFDPLGLIGPITVVAKLIIQRLWQYKLSWDESIPLELNTKWLQFKDQLSELNSIKIPRHAIIQNSENIELHGFSDASELAYGACIYVRSTDQSGNITSQLLCAKSRVCPLKNITLPRLELCAAVLLTHLAQKVIDSLTFKFNKCIFWTDSTITLGWIKGPPNKWKTFVANRVSEIQTLSDASAWFHVSTKDNPADLLSRGMAPHQLCTSDLWWHGPSWLTDISSTWPIQTECTPDKLPEVRSIKTLIFTTQVQDLNIISRYSCLSKLQRVYAYILRFIDNMKKPKSERVKGNLTVSELQNSIIKLVKISQMESFSKEISSLQNKQPVSKKSKLLCLNPFLDADNVLRVGGRLQHSKLSYDKRHQIILSPKHILTRLIAEREHRKLLHGGSQILLASLRESYWILNARNFTKAIVFRCISCFRAKPKETQFLMGSLPEARITPSFPFWHTGVDYAGPIFIKDKKSRGFKLTKAYFALFVCFSTKALHLEVVSDLTSENFIAALRRFISRRGKPQAIYSDNGTTFIGANTQLKELAQFLKEELNVSHIQNTMSNEGISWHFIPPRSPHHGGLWEAGVKSVKSHMTRIIGNANLVFEELNTLLVQIEAILNSRPLSPLTMDPTDLSVLTPAHFLIGRPLISAPDPNILHISENRLNMYQKIQSLSQHFWKRWSTEYLPLLQSRSKWKTSSQNLLQPGVMILIKEDNTPPLQWHLGRVTKLHPGQDGIVRVVTVRMKNGIFKRAVSKVCVLPMDTS